MRGREHPEWYLSIHLQPSNLNHDYSHPSKEGTQQKERPTKPEAFSEQDFLNFYMGISSASCPRQQRNQDGIIQAPTCREHLIL
jgi:hypothetical protein